MSDILSTQQLLAAEKIIQGAYYVKSIPLDFVNKPLGTFAIAPEIALDCYNVFCLEVSGNSKVIITLQIFIKLNGDYEIIDKVCNQDINKVLEAINGEKIICGIPLKLLQEWRNIYQQDSTLNLTLKLQEIKKFCDKNLIGSHEKINLPYVLHPSALKPNCLILTYFKMFEGLVYIDHIYLVYLLGIGLNQSGVIFHSAEDILNKYFTDQLFSYLSLNELEAEKIKKEEGNPTQPLEELPLKAEKIKKEEGNPTQPLEELPLKNELSPFQETDPLSFKPPEPTLGTQNDLPRLKLNEESEAQIKEVKNNLEDLKKDSKFYWKKKSARDISLFLKDFKKKGGFIFYEKTNGTPMVAYLQDEDVLHKQIIFPIETMEGLEEPIPFTDENLKHLLELKDYRLYSKKEVKKSLKEELNNAKKFQSEEKNKLEFKASIDEIFSNQEKVLPLISNYEKDVLNGRVGIAYSIGKREHMEDTHFANQITFTIQDKIYNGSLFGVFDGHGGDRCAKYIVNNIELFFKERLQKHHKKELNETDIFNAIKLTFVDLSKNFPESTGGSTATAAFVIGSEIFVANVGDSRTFIENKGEVTPLSVDAKPQFEKYRQGIEQREGEVVFSKGAYRVGRLVALARAIGDKNIKGITARPKITHYSLDKASLTDSFHLVLACDGLFESCSSKQAAREIYRLFREGKSNQEIATLLIKSAYEAGSKDNITVMIITFTPKF